MLRIFLIVSSYLLLIGSHTVTAQNAQYTINQEVWLPFMKAYTEFDYTSFNALHGPDLLRLSRKDIRYRDTYAEQNEAWFTRAKREGYQQSIELRFEYRTVHDNHAYETGCYKIDIIKPDQTALVYYGYFHILLERQDGRWVIEQDWDSPKVLGRAITNDDFLRLPPVSWHNNLPDLSQLGEAIGDRPMVQLLEWGQGKDGATYASMAQIIRYLHEQKGFNVMVWPIGLFEGELMNQALQHGNPQVAGQNLYAVWRQSTAIQALLSYLAHTQRTEKPLEVTGMSCQFHRHAKDTLLAYLQEQQKTLRIQASPTTFQQLDALWTSPKRLKNLTEDDFQQLRSRLQELSVATEAPAFSQRLLTNMQWFAELEYLRAFAPPALRSQQVEQHRDSSTLNNFRWLLDYSLKDEKIIVLGGTGTLRQLIPDSDLYSLGITAYEGDIGRPGKASQVLSPATEGSLEAHLHAQQQPYQFVDFMLTENVHLQQLDNRIKDKNPQQVLNGIFYLEQATPNQKAD